MREAVGTAHSCAPFGHDLPLLEAARPGMLRAMAQRLRVMIVDDNPRTRSALEAYVSTLEGMTVIGEACSGLEAIDCIPTQIPDIVLMDLCMPGMGGLEATRILKSRWPQIKVVVLTIYPNLQAEAKVAGADAFLVKGCSVGEMASTIRAIADEEPCG